MSRRVASGWASGLALTGALSAWPVLATAADTPAQAPLRVCVAEHNAPLSDVTPAGPKGFEVRIARALAESLGRPLQVVPFESAYEKESTLAHEVNALLSSGVCDLASGFPLQAQDLGAPSRPSARTPDYPGAARKRERPYVPLGPLVASRAYYRSALAVVGPASAGALDTVAQLRGTGWRIGAPSGSLAGTWLMLVGQGALRSNAVSMSQREDLFEALNARRVDAVMLPLSQWDAWRAGASSTPYQVTLRKVLPWHLGFVARATQSALVDRLNAVLAEARASGALAGWAQAEGLSWVAPAEPEIARGFNVAALVQE